MKRYLGLVLGLLLLAPLFASAQGFRFRDQVLDGNGRPVSGATIRVCTEPATGSPCTPLASIFTDLAATNAKTNPFTADTEGFWDFVALPGLYTMEISSPLATTRTLINVGEAMAASENGSAWLRNFTSDPSVSLNDGQLWYRSDTDEFRFRQNGITTTIPSSEIANFKRLNDIRLVDPNLWTESTVTDKIDAAIAEFGPNPGLVLLPSNLGAGDPTSTPDNVSILDLRTAGQVHVGDPRDATHGLTLGGVLEVNFNESKLTSGNFSAGLVVNAIGKIDTGAAVNGTWFNCRHRMDSCLGMTHQGAKANGILIDIKPDANTGAPLYGVHWSSTDTLGTNYMAWQVPTRITGGNNNLGPQAWFIDNGGSGAVFRGGQIWLKKGDSNQRRAVVAAPTNVASSITGETGTLSAGHYRFKVTALNDIGESVGSAATADLVAAANDVIEVTWDRVVGARAYLVYVAFDANADPGTGDGVYWMQHIQLSTGNLDRLLVAEPSSSPSGQASYKLWRDPAQSKAFTNFPYHDGHPPATDRSKFYYLRASANTINGQDPANDLFKVDVSGFWTLKPGNATGHPFSIEFPGVSNLDSLFRIRDGTNDWLRLDDTTTGGTLTVGNTAGLARVTVKGSGGNPDLQLQGATGSANPIITSGTGSIDVQGLSIGFTGFTTTSSALNQWASAVTAGDADGAFKLTSNNSFAAGDLFFSFVNSGAEIFRVEGDGTATISGGIAADGSGFKHARVSTGSISAGASAAVTLTWPTAFPDASYTLCGVSVVEATAGTDTLRVHHVEAVSATDVTVRVVNDDGSNAKTGTLHICAVHD